MIDKSIRQWYASGLLVKKGPPGTRPGFRYGPHGPSGPPPGEPGGPPDGPDMDSITQAMDGEVEHPTMPEGPDMPEGGAEGGDVPPPDDHGDEVV